MATKIKNGGFSYNAFDPMADAQTKKAWDDLQKSNANKPVNYTPVWQDEADSYLKQYQDRGPFSYDYNADALYQQYKDNYVKQGQMAMMDTMGQAAALTGGYGNSYAQTVGQQAYNQQLGQLNAVMPELYGMAYDRYQQEGQELLNQYDLYMGREAQEYSKYQDSLDNWYRENTMLQDTYDTLYNRAYGNWELGYNAAWDSYLADQENTSRIEAAKIEASKGPEYTKLEVGSDAYKIITNAIKGAKSLDELKQLMSEYSAFRYDPKLLGELSKAKKKELTPKDVPRNYVPYDPEFVHAIIK